MGRSSRAPGAAIVGAGLVGRWHAHACRSAGGRVAAIVDVDDGAARKLAGPYRAVAARTIDELRGRSGIDVIHICTPAESHERDVMRALSLKRPLIVEKPVAQSESATERLLASARDAGTWIEPVHQLVFQDGVRHAQQWIQRCGMLRLLDYRLCSAGATASEAPADRIAADVLPHPLSLFEVLAPGGVAAVQAWGVSHPSPGELNAVGVAGEAVCRIFVSMHGRPPCHELMLVADGGTLTADLFHGFAREDLRGTSRAHKAARPLAASGILLSKASSNLLRRALKREFAYPGLTALVAAVYRAASTTGAPRPIGDAHLLAVARSRDRILTAIPSVIP